VTLQARTNAAVKNIDTPMLMCVWQELEYHINVCRVTHGAHIEQSPVAPKNKKILFQFSCGCEESH
jgi:hypothetical protein